MNISFPSKHHLATLCILFFIRLNQSIRTLISFGLFWFDIMILSHFFIAGPKTAARRKKRHYYKIWARTKVTAAERDCRGCN